jgi:hypothetical protein
LWKAATNWLASWLDWPLSLFKLALIWSSVVMDESPLFWGKGFSGDHLNID